MPDQTPSSEDPFADLYGRLPDARSRAESPPPQSRRAAREAAGRSGDTPAEPAQSAQPARPAQPAPTRAQPTQRPAEPARPAASPEPTAQLDALFAAAPRDPRKLKKSRRGAGPWIALGIVVLLLGGIAGGGLWVWNTYQNQIRSFMGWEEPKDYEDGIAEGEATITIRSGDGGQAISQTLFDAGVTKTPEAFYNMLIKLDAQPTFYPGVYHLQQKMSASAALTALQDPANKMEYSVQLPEGLTKEQTVQRISDSLGMPLEELTAAIADPSVYQISAGSIEGWLFPATYTFDPGVTATDIIQTLVNRTVQSLDAAGVPVADRQRILTIASIIQREARLNDDFYKVSRVIQNRLDDGMMLQMDSTAQYGYGELHDGTASSSSEALTNDNPWNTYVHTGLPVGPISNPGDVAIDAAMHPVDGPWLYFVTVDLKTGETVFTTTIAEHEAAVEQWRQWCRANPDSGC
jgi:UPF0755 protein